MKTSNDPRAILLAGAQLWQRERDLDATLSDYCANVARCGRLNVRTAVPVADRASVVAELLARTGLPPDIGRDRLEEDISELTALVAELEGVGHCLVRLDADPAAACPLFHVDAVRLRLLCTYHGPTTEWLAPVDVDREELGLRGRTVAGANAAIVSGPVQSLQTGAIAIIKGARFEGGDHSGLVHRSPDPARGPRLLLAIDPMPDHHESRSRSAAPTKRRRRGEHRT